MEPDVRIFFLYRADELHDGKSGAALAAADIDIAGDTLWVSVFNPQNWNRVKEEFDSGRNIGKMEGWNFWKEFFDRWKMDAFLVTPDSSYDRTIKDPDPQFENFMSLCLGR